MMDTVASATAPRPNLTIITGYAVSHHPPCAKFGSILLSFQHSLRGSAAISGISCTTCSKDFNSRVTLTLVLISYNRGLPYQMLEAFAKLIGTQTVECRRFCIYQNNNN